MFFLIKKNKILPVLIVVWTLIWTLARSLRLPNGFSQAHWLLNYQLGFIKRGFVGTVVLYLSKITKIPLDEKIIFFLSALALLVFCLILLYQTEQIAKSALDSNGAYFVGIIFLASPFVVMNAHLIGYFDNLIYILTFLVLFFTINKRFWWASIISAVAVLVHENFLLTGFPLFVLGAGIFYVRAGTTKEKRKIILALLIPLLTFGGLWFAQNLLEVTILRQQIIAHINAYPFVSDQGVSIATYQTTSWTELFQNSDWLSVIRLRIFNPAVFLPLLPTIILLFAYILFAFRISPRSLLGGGIILAALAPLGIHLVAWDSVRISVYVLGNLFFIIWLLAETNSFYVLAPQKNIFFLFLGIGVLLFNIYIQIPLMNNEIERFSFLQRTVIYLPVIGSAFYRLGKNLLNLAKQRENLPD